MATNFNRFFVSKHIVHARGVTIVFMPAQPLIGLGGEVTLDVNTPQEAERAYAIGREFILALHPPEYTGYEGPG